MSRESSLTFEGALRILGKHEHKIIGRIDKLLGGVLLGGGAVAGAVALGVVPLTPIAAFGLVWGWVEQKGLAIDLLKSAIDGLSERLSGLRGHERRELIAAAHSTIVVSAFFESLRDEIGESLYKRLKITDDEKRAVISEMLPFDQDEGVKYLYSAQIPAPSAVYGFEENVERVARWQAEYGEYVHDFLSGLAVTENARMSLSPVTGAVERYRSRYLELAAKVPEFAIWAQLGEHAATRSAISETGDEVMGGIEGIDAALRELNADVTAGFNANREVLNRVEALLSAGMHKTAAGEGESSAGGMTRARLSSLQQTVSWANAGILDERIFQADREQYPAGLEIPRVSEIYINPRYRVAAFTDQARLADERWWKERESYDDFDIFLARHITSPDATRRPLLLLGHPGAGKSLLTKVFAARLPASEYTVVRVPLRRVSADAEIHHQIEEALDICTHRRIPWSDLADQSGETVRVVLLDGLDELLQASGHDRSRYLEDVEDFQERENMQQRPVVAVVTSRTVVADRVRVPDGTTIVKLDPFNDDDVADWLRRWKRVNADAIATGTMGELTLNGTRRQPELAEQPLLLLMLALYAADLELPPLDEEMATAELYRRLLHGFARREAGKDLESGHNQSADEFEQRVRDHLDRLGVAALGMFNRRRQDISEDELGKDLEALEPRLMARSPHTEAGRRIIAEFFFVHAPEAWTIADPQARTGQPKRAYEFMHATFGEYLVARQVMDELTEVAARVFSGRRAPTEPDDNLLFALLSHQALATRQSMLDFAQEIFTGLDDKVRPQVLETLEMLARSCRNRCGSNRYAAYRPVPPDQVHQLACYSANLFTLRICVELESAVPLTKLIANPEDTSEQWRSIVTLWKSALDYDALQALVITMDLTDGRSCLTNRKNQGAAMISSPRKDDSSATLVEMGLAHLAGDLGTERILRYGAAVTSGSSYFLGNDPWIDVMSAALISQMTGQRTPIPAIMPPENTPDSAIKDVARHIFLYLRSEHADRSADEELLRLLFRLPGVFNMDALALTVAVLTEPDLINRIPELENLELYGRYAAVVSISTSADILGVANFKHPNAGAVAMLQSTLAHHRRRTVNIAPL